MGILKKVLSQNEDNREQEPVAAEPERECPHTALVPHWDAVEDMGNSEKATYRCEACGNVFSSEQAQEFLNKPPEVLATIRDDR
jgi:hypothetical protein